MEIKKFEAYKEYLADDIHDEYESENDEDFDSKEWEVDHIIDIMDEDPTKSEEESLESDDVSEIDENAITFDTNVPKDVRRGDYIWLTALLKRKGSPNHPGRQGVIKARITEIFYGLAHLNKVMNR